MLKFKKGLFSLRTLTKQTFGRSEKPESDEEPSSSVKRDVTTHESLADAMHIAHQQIASAQTGTSDQGQLVGGTTRLKRTTSKKPAVDQRTVNSLCHTVMTFYNYCIQSSEPISTVLDLASEGQLSQFVAHLSGQDFHPSEFSLTSSETLVQLQTYLKNHGVPLPEDIVERVERGNVQAVVGWYFLIILYFYWKPMLEEEQFNITKVCKL
jgi:hypothetical protein